MKLEFDQICFFAVQSQFVQLDPQGCSCIPTMFDSVHSVTVITWCHHHADFFVLSPHQQQLMKPGLMVATRASTALCLQTRKRYCNYPLHCNLLPPSCENTLIPDHALTTVKNVLVLA